VGAEVRKWKSEQLRDVDFTMRALSDAMLDGDEKAIKEIIKNHFEAINAAKALDSARISKRTFYDAVSEKGNPSLKTMVKIIHAMKSA
jgi:DNA-binding phage protein